jgi:hypothetical protein
MTKQYRKRGGQGKNVRSSFEPPQVFTMDRDIESQIPISKGDLRYSESGDFIPPPPPFYREVRKKTNPEPLSSDQQVDEIDAPFGERTFVGPQQKTSIRQLQNDIESPLQNNQEFSGLDKNSGYGIYDDQFDGGKRRKTRNRRKYVSNKRKRKTKKRISNRKNKK